MPLLHRNRGYGNDFGYITNDRKVILQITATKVINTPYRKQLQPEKNRGLP